ncbi:MAG: glycoside hydrolase, partial [Proteobacteria bacterium]|nr:glycoside hydrolase [Pseudomonadota bacterium]
NTDTLYCSNNSTGGIYKSTDNGITWNSSSNGLPSMAMGSLTLYDEVYSLAQGGNGRIYAGLESGEVYYSDNQGVLWNATTVLPGIGSRVCSIAAGAGGLVYVGTEGDGVYKSIDGGTSWSPKNNGLPVSANVSGNGLLLDSTSGDLFLPLVTDKVYRSSDGGDSWVPADPEIGCGSAALAMDSTKNLFGVFCHGAVYKSSDKGNSWTDMSDGLGAMDNVEGINIQGIFANKQDLLLLSTSSDGVFTFSQSSFAWTLFLPAIISSRQ